MGAAGLFMLPALALYAVFVLFPIVQAARYSLYDWNGLEPLDRLHRAGQLPARAVRPGVPGRGQPQRVHRHPVAGRPDPVRARDRADAQPPLPRPHGAAPDLLRPVRHRGGHHRDRLEPDPPAQRAGRQPADDGRPGGPLPALAGRSGHRPRRPVLHHHVEVLRVLHDPAAGRSPGDPARGRGGRLHRRRVAPAVAALRDPAPPRPDDPGLDLPVDHRLAAAVRPRSGSRPAADPSTPPTRWRSTCSTGASCASSSATAAPSP